MNIVLFGGSFNPPHLGHSFVISQAFELIPNLDELWLLPDYHHTFAKESHFAPANHRVNMAKFLTTDHVRVESCAIDQQMTGSTREHLDYLQQHYPEHSFSFLIGSDNLIKFNHWVSWEELLERMPFYVYPRAGYPTKPLYPHMTALDSPTQIISNLSSTLIRGRLKAGLSITPFVPAKVAAYIAANKLYY